MPSHRRRNRRLQRADQSAAGPSSGERKPQAASPKTREQQPKAKSTGGRAISGQASASSSSTQGQTGVKGSRSTRVSAGSAMDTSGRMKSSEEDQEHEKMDVDDVPDTDTDSKRNAMGARSAWSPPTGRSDHRDSERGIGSKDSDEDLPPATGGEGDHGGLSDSQDSDSGRMDTYVVIEESPMKKWSQNDATGAWKGVPLHNLQRTPDCLPPDLKLERSDPHFCAIRLPFVYGEDQRPQSYECKGRWDKDHVRMPFADESKCMRKGKEKKRWEVIVEALNAPISGTFELEEAILKYNQRYINKWKFTVLHHYFTNCVKEEDCQTFFHAILPMMKQLAMKLPEICPVVPLLKTGKAKKVTMSQYQIACLLANAFFCTFPLRNARTRATEYSAYPDINFAHLFVGDPVPRKVEKLRCIIHYFKRVMGKEPSGIVTFSRQVLSSDPGWRKSMDNLTKLHVSSTGTIEGNGQGMLQVDFANKYIGGGVLGHGCVQEEIRFMICPEMIVTRLFTECLDDNESLIMTGCEQYSEYRGYSDTFQWKGDFIDQTERDKLGRLCCEVVAIDAQVFRADYSKQFEQPSISRELNKAYCGFKTSNREEHRSAVCTGNWGCGAFGGDKELKALIQVLAASVAKRDVCYFTFNDDWLTNHLSAVHDRLCRENKTVGDVYAMLVDYRHAPRGGRYSSTPSLFDFIHHQLNRRKPVNRPPQRRESEEGDKDPFLLSARDKADVEERSQGRERPRSMKEGDKKKSDFFSHGQEDQDQKNAGSKSSGVDVYHDKKEEEESRKDGSMHDQQDQKKQGGSSPTQEEGNFFWNKNVDNNKAFSGDKWKKKNNNLF